MDPRSTPSHGVSTDLVGNNNGPPQTHTQDGSMPPLIGIGSLDPDQGEEEDVNEGVDNVLTTRTSSPLAITAVHVQLLRQA